MTDSYLSGVSEMYQGEVLGEALFSHMASLAKSDDQRIKLSMLLQLESEAKVRLRPFVARLGLSVVEDEAWRVEGIRLAVRLSAMSWKSFLREFNIEIGEYIARYEEIQRMGPPSDQVTLQFMVVHETALRSFFERELDGQPEISLRNIVGLLEYPLPY